MHWIVGTGVNAGRIGVFARTEEESVSSPGITSISLPDLAALGR
jgi:hypothetical protein